MTKFERLIPTESEEQQALFRYCGMETQNYPDLNMLVHIPNEGKRTAANGARLKSEGLRKGYPDILLDAPMGKYHGLRIELKRRKGSRIAAEQKTWIIKLNNRGYAAAFCYGWEEAWDFIHAYLRCGKSANSEQIVERYITRSLKECETT